MGPFTIYFVGCFHTGRFTAIPFVVFLAVAFVSGSNIAVRHTFLTFARAFVMAGFPDASFLCAVFPSVAGPALASIAFVFLFVNETYHLTCCATVFAASILFTDLGLFVSDIRPLSETSKLLHVHLLNQVDIF